MTASGALVSPTRAPGFLYQADTAKNLLIHKSGTQTVASLTGPGRIYNDTDRPWKITAVRASVGTAPTGATLIVDVNIDGTTAYTTQANRPAIAVSTNTKLGTLPDIVTVPAGSYISADVDQIGSSTAGSDLVVQITVVPA